MKRTGILILVFVLLSLAQGAGLYAQKYRVLYINSYHMGFSWTDEVTSGFLSNFADRDSFMVMVEFMDAKRQLPQQSEQWFLPYLLNKYSADRFDVIVVSDNSALDFVLKHRNIPIFKDIPLVFCGISNVTDYPLEKADLYGVIESNMFVASFDVMRNMYPEFRTIYLFVDRTNTGQIYKKEALDLIKAYPDYKLVVKDSIYLDEIESLMAGITDTSIVYYQGVSSDGKSNLLDHYEVARKVFKEARVPVFSSYIVDVEGALGGQYQGGFEHGKLCASLAEKRLKGIAIPSRVNTPPMAGIYDYSKMQMYNLDVANVPANAKFRNRPESIWSKYRSIIVGNVLFIFFLILVIVVLFRYNKSQKKARKMMEGAMSKALESDNLKGAFLANVSHELRTPLNAICGFSELLLTEELTPEAEKYVDVINKNSELLTMLVNDLLDISLIDANAIQLNPSQVDLDALFALFQQQTLSVMKMKNKQHLNIEIQKNPVYRYINTDSLRVSQIMLNLINNAIKYTDAGGIVIGYDHVESVRSWLPVPPPGDAYLVFYVQDTGVGIDPEKQHLVFERFRSVDSKFVSQHGGFGLGLNISRSLVTLLGGEIFVTSQVGKGSVFGFFLPL